MPSIRTDVSQNGVPIVRLESAQLRVDVAPEVGGRVVSLYHKASGHEFLWRNPGLELARLRPGSEYDPNFFGGIDELLPNDMPEELDGIPCPDHGELWTTPLQSKIEGDRVILSGRLDRCGLEYQREIRLHADQPCLDFLYTITNSTAAPRHFLWKLHAAVAIQPGDVIECPAGSGQVVDPAWSRFKTVEPFAWPNVEGQDAHVLPERNGAMDFFYLSGLEMGWMAWRRPAAGLVLGYEFDRTTFPYAWLFASYGGFLSHYTAILEPCTTMPISVREAAGRQQCSRLEPGEVLQTSVLLWAGRDAEISGPRQNSPVLP